MSVRCTTNRRFAVAAALFLAPLAFANDVWTGYDTSRHLTLGGIVREVGSEPPHRFIVLDTPGRTWRVMLPGPSRAEGRKLPTAMLKIGEPVQVEGFASRTDPRELRADRITIANKTIELR